MKKSVCLIFVTLISVVSIFVSINKPKEVKKEYKNERQLIAYTIDGQTMTSNFPNKEDGYIGESVTCTNGVTGQWNNDTWKLELNDVTTTTSCTINFIEYTPYFYEQILANNPNVETRSDFSAIFTESNNGNTIYKASGQDGKDTYYFAGTVTNNYVYFGGYYWRIVRINEDNSVRLIYAGTSASDTAGFINTSQAYNSNYDNSAYVGYMYTTSQQHGLNTNSSIKSVVDTWYQANLLPNYDGYISKTAIYCNDRGVGSGSWSATGNTFYYAAYARLVTSKSPTYICSNEADRFTASETVGNGALTYPIGLITADEVAYAGGVRNTNNSSYYIAQNASNGASYWWTMSPYNWYGSADAFFVGGSSGTGYLSHNGVYDSRGVRPVISLKSCVLASGGSGTASDPYTVGLSEGCANVDNEVPKNPVTVSVATNDTSMATVVAPSSVIVSSGNSYTFEFNVNSGYEYESVTGCNGEYNVVNNTLTLENITSNTTCTVNYKEKEETFADRILLNNPNVSERTSFSEIYTKSNNGNTIYKASGQDGLDTYYFAGAVTNNYVYFGGYYWRIVRINEDNSVRLIYAGTSATDKAGFISTSQKYNTDSNNSAYVGYMYTTSEQYGNNASTDVKNLLDEWYVTNLMDYDNYISKTAIYCSDRTVGNGTWSATGSTTFRYSAYVRIQNKKQPIYECTNETDRFTVSASTGNGALTYPIGMITADEVSYAGGLWNTNNTNYYIAQNAKSGATYWWTMTPNDWNGTNSRARIIRIGGTTTTGYINATHVANSFGVRPVISLKSCVKVLDGDGTSSNPYTISLTNSCATLEN